MLAELDRELGLAVTQAAIGAGVPHLTVDEQRLLNYKWSISCFAIIDCVGTSAEKVVCAFERKRSARRPSRKHSS